MDNIILFRGSLPQSETLVLKSDKTNNTVLMFQSEYHKKIEELLNDTSIYRMVTDKRRNPTTGLQSRNNELIRKIYKKMK